MKEEAKKVKKDAYSVNPEFVGMAVYTLAPTTYKRKDGGKFVLNSELSQKDLKYLYEVQAERKAVIKN